MCLGGARRAASPHPPLSQGIKTRRPSLLFHVCFLFPSHIGHPPRFCSGLRPFVCGPSPIVECSIAASGEASAPAMPEHHWPSISRSLDRSSHALPIAHPHRSLGASRVVLSQSLLCVSTLFASCSAPSKMVRVWGELKASVRSTQPL